jgi:gluconate kinase
MPASPVASRFATLEPPGAEAVANTADVLPDPQAIVREAIAALRRRGELA